jgi:polar amino acid transport system permease protein
MVNWDYLSSLQFGVAWEYRQALASGLEFTLVLFCLAAIFGLIGGVALAILSRLNIRAISWTIIGFVELFRNTPLLVQLMWIYFALPALSGLALTAFQSGVLALSLNASAYFSEIVRAGIDAVPRGQWDAGRALGLGLQYHWRFVILPQAFRVVIPPIGNMMISLLKGTAILSIISIPELMRATTRISTHTARPVELFTSAAVIYFIIGCGLVALFSVVERKVSLKTRSQ